MRQRRDVRGKSHGRTATHEYSERASAQLKERGETTNGHECTRMKTSYSCGFVFMPVSSICGRARRGDVCIRVFFFVGFASANAALGSRGFPPYSCLNSRQNTVKPVRLAYR